MLAPLKDRSQIEREMPPLGADPHINRLEAENLALRQALRQSRQAQKRSAALGARKIVAQSNEISRLQSLLDASRERVSALESGQAIVELGQRLMALGEANEQLAEAARRVWLLDKTVCAAHEECARLAGERDRAIRCLEANARAGLKILD